MASQDSVRASVEALVASMADVDDEVRRKIPDRTISVWILDLDLAYAGRFEGGYLRDVEAVDPARRKDANLRLELDSDTLLELVEGELTFAHGWATGRVHVDARLRDIWELRRFI